MPANTPSPPSAASPHPPGDGPAPGQERLEPTGERDGVAIVEVTSGPIVESRHRVRMVIADPGGQVLDHWGDVDHRIYPRSAIKPIQALPIVETGAADAFGLSNAELALACGSHTGEPVHVDAVTAWLQRIGCGVGDLECGAQTPNDGEAAHALRTRGEAPSALHNNCSGKHAGFLTTARHRNEPTAGYTAFTHPVQQRLLGVLEQMTAQDLHGAPWAADGCSIPTIAVPLGGLAMAMARMATLTHVPDQRAAAIDRVRRAWGGEPYMVAGRDRFDTALMTATGGRVLVKQGAEGVACACLPDQGLGIALKVEDGTKRAAHVAMGSLLHGLGAIGDQAWAIVAGFTMPQIRTRRGVAVGTIRLAGR